MARWSNIWPQTRLVPESPGLPQTPWFIGLMSGTSMDGIDAALLRTDGEAISDFGPALTLSYEMGLRDRIRACLNDGPGHPLSLSRELAVAHASAVQALLDKAGMAARDIAWLGFHGHTLLH